MKKQILLILTIAATFNACSFKSASKQDILLQNNQHTELLELEFEQNSTILPNIIKPVQVKKDEFLYKYFKIWNNTKPDTSAKEAFWGIETYNNKNKIYYGANRRPYDAEFFKKIKDNANISEFGYISLPAVTINNAILRNLPTKEPVFYDFKESSQGYPFDYLSNSAIGMNYPLYVSHYTKDKTFAFVQNDAVWGWIDTRDIKILNRTETDKFKNANYITVLNDKTAVYDIEGNFLFNARVGSLLALNKETDNEYIGFVMTNNGFKEYKISKENAAIWPAVLNNTNIKKTIQSLLGEPYGWGGFGYYRDCSLTTRDILAGYGIWLPRNSKAQANMYNKIPLFKKSNEEKLSFIKQHATAYLTLLHLPGHIMLYTGMVDDKVTAVHSVWGIKTSNNARALIAQTAITTLEIGKNKSEIKPQNLILSRIDSMTVIGKSEFNPVSVNEMIKNSNNLDKKAFDIKFVNNNMIKSDAVSNRHLSKEEILKISYGVLVKDNKIIFKDGSNMVFDDKKMKSEKELLNNPDVEDMLSYNYPALSPIFEPKNDIGRIRNEEFLNKIYGNQNEIESNLKFVSWLPKHVNKLFKFNTKNNAAKAFEQVSLELDEMVSKKPQMLKYLNNPSGTFNYRKISKTNRLSAHSWGIAIDINTDQSNYWQWSKTGKFENKIPYEIIQIFERNKFIWGGRWKHFDTMHFEYRPEYFTK